MSTRTTEDIIISAFQMLGQITPNEVPSQGQIQIAFNLLNDIIGAWSMSGVYIPFETKIPFVTTGGFDKYLFTSTLQPIGPPPSPGEPIVIASNQIITLDYVNCSLSPDDGTLVYQVRILSKAEFYESSRVQNAPGPPVFCFLDRQATQSIVQFYPVPNIAYPVEIKAKVALDYITRFTNITALPPFYYRFMRYAIARELLQFYPSSNWTAQAEQQYNDMRNSIQSANDWNCTVKTDMTLNMGRRLRGVAVNGMIII